MKSIKFIFFIAFTILFFYLIFKNLNIASLKEILININWYYLAVATLIILLTSLISARKWQVILKAIDHNIKFTDSFNIIMATYPVSATTPAKAGDLIKAHYLKNSIPSSQIIGAVVTERLIDIVVLSLYSLVGAIILKNQLILIIALSIIFLIPLLLITINKIKIPFLNWQNRINNFSLVSKVFFKKPQKLLPVIFYSLMLWLFLIISVKVLFLSFGINIPFLYMITAFPMAVFIGLIPITIAGMGTRDSAIIYLFSFWAGPSICLGVGLLYSLIAYWLLALLGLPFMKKKL
jgi:hypothetical protein